MRNKNLDVKTIKNLVLDEFDKALELGFHDDMEYIIENMYNLYQRILTSATSMDEIPKFTGLKNEKTVDFLKLADNKPDIQLRKVKTTPEKNWTLCLI